MADDRGHKENTPLTPDEVSQHEFATTFRGYDPAEVREFLDRVSGRVRALEELSRGLRGRLAQMQADARAGRGSAATEDAGTGVVDETLLLDALGEQAAHILRTAHEAADAVARAAAEAAGRRLAGEPGRSLPTLPTSPKSAEPRPAEPRAGDSRSSDVVQKRTFTPRPEPPVAPARTRPAGPSPAPGG